MAGARARTVVALGLTTGAAGFALGHRLGRRGDTDHPGPPPRDDEAANGSAPPAAQAARPGSSSPGAADAQPSELEGRRAAEHGRDADRPSDIPARGWRDIATRVAKEVKADNVPITSAGVAFYALLALAPTLIALLSIYGLVASPATVAKEVKSLTDAMPRDAASVVVTQLEQITKSSSSGLGLKVVLSLVLVLWSASSGMVAIMRGLGIAYDEPERRSYARLRGAAIVLTIGGIVEALLVLTVALALPTILDKIGLAGIAKAAGIAGGWVLIIVAALASLAVVYRYGPSRERARWRWVSWGAVVALVLWGLGTLAFGIYANNFSKYNQTYGALAGTVVLLLWLFLTALAILVGAEVNAELERQTRKDTTTGPDAPLGRRQAYAADTVGESSDGADGGPADEGPADGEPADGEPVDEQGAGLSRR